MSAIKTYIDKDGTIYWNKFNGSKFSPIPCPYSGNACTGFCPHNYVFEGINFTVLGFTCGQQQKGVEYEVELHWHEKPDNIIVPFGIGYKKEDSLKTWDELMDDKGE